MKKLILSLLVVCSYIAEAQIVQYSDLTKQSFFAIGGYSYSEQSFPAGVQTTPNVLMGPSPQNDFVYVATANGGIKNLNNAISTTNVGTGITLKMKNNNIRKFGANVISKTPDGINITFEAMILSVYTNQGNGQSYIFSNSSITWMGLVATGENEYIDSVKVRYASASTNVITIGDIIVGDNQAQNVALNFDGVNDHVALPSTVGNFASNATFTVSCWVKPATLQSDLVNTDVEILEKWEGTSNAYPFVIRYLNENIANGANVGKIVAARYNGIANPTIMSSVSIDDNKWHHIALVVDALGMKLYIDGNLSASGNNFTPQQANTSCTNNSTLYVGSRNTINHFKGEIDEVRLWTVGKTQTEIQNERFCKNPNTTDLQAAFNLNNGVPNSNNALITQVPDAVGTNHGILSGFAKTGDASNFVTGQVKYVKNDAPGGNNGSSWANAFTNLQDALNSTECNDLFDVYVATGTYKPDASNINIFFIIPSGMRMYGGFAGTEKSINERNLALIDNTNQTTLSGDLEADDLLSDFTQNRTDNSKNVINIGGKSNVLIDGFSIRGGFGAGYGGGILAGRSSNCSINRVKFFDNQAIYGGAISASNVTNLKIINSTFLGNKSDALGDALYIEAIDSQASFFMNNSVIAGHIGDAAIFVISQIFSGIPVSTSLIHSYLNCTFVNNNRVFTNESQSSDGAPINFSLKNCIIYGNTNDNSISVFGGGGPFIQSITNSLVQGETSTANGNLVGTTNPQFVFLPVPAAVPSTAGDYRLKWCSLAIDAGNNTGISPLDLDRNPRLYRTNVDMGAYEHMGNTPTGASPIDITYTIDIPNYEGVGVQRITSAAKILAPAGTVNFTAPNSITLNPGFEARGVGKYFKAQIGANVACSN